MASDDLKLLIHTSNIPNDASIAEPAPPKSKPRRRFQFKARLSFQERLLRNSFLACAVLLGVLALSNIEQPWAKQATEGIEQALSMKVDLDESLGQLSFVCNLVPESALVFFNLSGEDDFVAPVQAEQTHAFSTSQPWYMYAVDPGEAVCAAAAGTVSAISPLSDGTFGVLIDHGEGLESVTAV